MNVNPDAPVSMNLSSRIIGTFLSPRAVFEDVAGKPTWLPTLLFICIINLAFSLLTIPKVREFTEITLQAQLQAVPEAADFTAMVMQTISITTIAGAAFSPVIFCLVAAGLLKLCNMFTAEPTPYRKFYAVSVYACLPMLIASIIASILTLMTPAANLSEVSTGLYLLFPPGSTGFAAALARQVDPFYLWTIFLVAMGGAVISRGKTKSYAIFMFALWAIFAVGSAFLNQ